MLPSELYLALMTDVTADDSDFVLRDDDLSILAHDTYNTHMTHDHNTSHADMVGFVIKI